MRRCDIIKLSHNTDLLANGLPASRRRRKTFHRYRVEMTKPLTQEKDHRHEFVHSHRGADIGQQVSHIVDPGLIKDIHARAIDTGPHNGGRDSENPSDDCRLLLLAGVAELSDALVVVLQGIPDSDKAASLENRQAQLVHHHAVVDKHLDDRFRSISI